MLQAAYVNASVLLTALRRSVEQLHGANAGRYKVIIGKGPLTYTWSQILHRLPKAWFRPVGQTFINVYNQRFNGHLGPEWAGRSMANILYHCVISFHNYSHPCFDKTAPARLQVNIYQVVIDCIFSSRCLCLIGSCASKAGHQSWLILTLCGELQ